MTRRSRSRSKSAKIVNYRDKLTYIRKFARVSRKGAKNKSFLTRKYRELHRLRQMRFVRADRKKIRKLTAKVPHTNKGFFVPKEKGMKGAIDKAAEMVKEIENSWMPQQFENEANTEAHRKFTAKEILKDFPVFF